MMRQIPNLICLLRMALVLPISWTLTHDRPMETLWMFLLAALSDGADGFLAKRFGWQTDIGAVLDPAADKILLVTVFVVLAFEGAVPMWLAATVLGRDLVIVFGHMAYRKWFGPIAVQPSTVSKINTVCQLTFVLAVVAQAAFHAIPYGWIDALGALAFVTTVVSGMDYVIRYSKRAYAQSSGRSPVASQS
jgi:cardiolipin synthase (CMP-forming)